MDRKRRSTVIGAALIFIGTLAGVLLAKALTKREQPVFLEFSTAPTLGTATALLPTEAQRPRAIFTAADAEKISLRYGENCTYRPNVEALLLQTLDWDLTNEEPTVLILHSHASESYTKTDAQDYRESSSYRTLDTSYNMVATGDALAARLREAGIGVVHDRRIHDYPSYNNAYQNSRDAASAYLQQYPSIRIVLDLHRDAVLLSDGSQYAPTVELDGKRVAQLMLVVGTDGAGASHPDWQKNLALALKLQVLLERAAEGITRPTILRTSRYNQDLSSGALLIEIGAAGNTLDEAMAAVEPLAQALIGLTYGAN